MNRFYISEKKWSPMLRISIKVCVCMFTNDLLKEEDT